MQLLSHHNNRLIEYSKYHFSMFFFMFLISIFPHNWFHTSPTWYALEFHLTSAFTRSDHHTMYTLTSIIKISLIFLHNSSQALLRGHNDSTQIVRTKAYFQVIATHHKCYWTIIHSRGSATRHKHNWIAGFW